MDEHFTTLEADFRHRYGIDLRRHSFHLGELWNLVVGLPLDSLTFLSTRGEHWSNESKLLAVVAEQIDAQSRLLARVYSKKGTKIPEGLRIEWPGRTPARGRVILNRATPAEVAQYAGRVKRVARGS